MNFSVVIPAHNEEEGVRPTVERLYGTLMEAGIPFEILVVNDHSTDATEQVLQALAREMPGVRYVNNPKPGGFGRAIQTGLERFRGDAVCIVMADASDDPQDVVTYYRKLQEGYECVFGSRFLRGSRVVEYPRLKLLINRAANAFIDTLFGLHFNDTTNAFKAYRREVIEGIKPFLSPHFNITVELPLKAITRGYTYTTVPINWYNRATGVSKLKIQEMGSRYLFIVLYVWLERLLSRGDYRRRNAPSRERQGLDAGAVQYVSANGASGAHEASAANGLMALDMGVDEIAPTLPRVRTIPVRPGEPAHSGPPPAGGVMTLDQPRSPARLGAAFPTNAVEPTAPLAAGAAVSRGSEMPQWALMLIVAVVAWALIVSRRPDAIFNAQFWAEDGIWFAQAYNQGALHALLLPYTGYLVTVQRVTAAFALLFPMLYAPLIFNIIAIFLQSLPVVFLFSGRFDELIPSRSMQVLLGFLYVALPNSFEVNATITNAQWHISVLAFMIVVAAVPRGVAGKAFDVFILLLSGLSGPFCVALVPILALRWWMDRRGYTILLFVVNGVTIIAQGVTYLISASSLVRDKAPLGATPLNLARLLAGQLFVGETLGMNQYGRIFLKTWWASNKLTVSIAAAGMLLIAVALWKGPAVLRLFLLYAGMIYGLSLISPLAIGTTPAWVQISYPGDSARYEYIPMIAFAAVLVWLLSRRAFVPLQAVGALALIIMLLIGVPSDWQYPAYADLHYGAYVQQFEALPAGSDFTFPTNPNWSMTLHKH